MARRDDTSWRPSSSPSVWWMSAPPRSRRRSTGGCGGPSSEPETRSAVIEGQACLCTPLKPSAGFSVANAVGLNKVVYGLSNATLVVASDLKKGGTWAGAHEAIRNRTCDVGVDGSERGRGQREAGRGRRERDRRPRRAVSGGNGRTRGARRGQCGPARVGDLSPRNLSPVDPAHGRGQADRAAPHTVRTSHLRQGGQRDAAIREAHRAGASLRDIVAESGISHMSVKCIVERFAD